MTEAPATEHGRGPAGVLWWLGAEAEAHRAGGLRLAPRGILRRSSPRERDGPQPTAQWVTHPSRPLGEAPGQAHVVSAAVKHREEVNGSSVTRQDGLAASM